MPYKTFDIVFYEGNNCSEDEVGLFDSQDLQVILECQIQNITSNYENKCENDEIRSVKIFPGIKQNIFIKVYNNKDGSYSDDVTRVHLGDIELNEPFCINSFEEQTTDEEKNNKITKTYYKRDGFIGNGIDGKISRIYLLDSKVKYDLHNIIFYEGKACSGAVTGLYKSNEESDEECTEIGGDNCQNYSIVSLKLLPVISKEIFIKI